MLYFIGPATIIANENFLFQISPKSLSFKLTPVDLPAVKIVTLNNFLLGILTVALGGTNVTVKSFSGYFKVLKW